MPSRCEPDYKNDDARRLRWKGRKCSAKRRNLLCNSGCNGDDRSVKIESLEAAKIMKIKWLVLGCIEANFCKYITV